MPELIPYSLTFPGGLHLGRGGVDLEETGVSMPADTLFSALLDAWRRLSRTVDELRAILAGSGE